MKIFNDNTTWSGKVNFVDDNNRFVGFDNAGCCCEDFGWLFLREKPTDDRAVSYRANEVKLSEEELASYQFDADFFERINVAGFDEGGYGVFLLRNADGETLYLVIYNFHNGYYSHGFSYGQGDTVEHEGWL